MWSPRHAIVSFFLAVLAATVLFGCRAFQPEAVIVNRPPETYIIGSPAETSGAYFHFHVYWYGTDSDGFVERYVWALTDTSIQKPETDTDEEDQNFNPATNIGTLAIGRYTTKTDSIFDFQINQGSNLSYDMTLHMVAIDDRGDFDRTPARLHFFSNALGQPDITFYRNDIAPDHVFAYSDTIAYGEPLVLRWAGSTPNTAYYEPDLLAMRDTVPEVLPPGQAPDGLLGFKWFVVGEGDCDPSTADCWNPRRLNEATGDSFSVFGDVNRLVFLNDGSASGVFGRKLRSGVLQVMVNTIDIAGVQVPLTSQTLNIVVNYDPDTYMLRGEMDPAYNDTSVYPYYVVFHGNDAGRHIAFAEGDTVPDNAYVVFKALGWDDRRDERVSAQNLLSFQGLYEAVGLFNGTSPFPFSATASDTHRTQEWTAADPTEVSSDTIGFLVGPFEYSMIMRSVDEHGRRDGTPDTLRFVGNYPPCVQCIELSNTANRPTFQYQGDCYDHACLDQETVLHVYFAPNTTDPTQLTRSDNLSKVYWNRDTGDVTFNSPSVPAGYDSTLAYKYTYRVYLHGKDPEQEHWAPGQAIRRIGSWRYRIDYAADTGNAISDGSGGASDNLDALSGFNLAGNDTTAASDLFIYPSTGVWGVRVAVGVPSSLLFSGPAGLWATLLDTANAPVPAGTTHADTLAWQALPEVQDAYVSWHLTTMQFSPGTVRAVANDAAVTCAYRPSWNMYHYFAGVRPPANHGRACTRGVYDQPGGIVEDGAFDLKVFAAESNRGEPVGKPFQIVVHTGAGDFVGGGDPPGWIPDGKSSGRVAWR